MWRKLQRFPDVLRQVAILGDVAAAYNDAAFAAHELFAELLEVQQLERLVRQVVRFRNKSVLRGEPAELLYGMYLVEQMALAGAVSEVEEPVHRDNMLAFLLFHFHQPLVDGAFLIVQLRELCAERVELVDAAAADPVVKFPVSEVLADFPIRFLLRRHAELVQRVEHLIGRERERRYAVGIAFAGEFNGNDFIQMSFLHSSHQSALPHSVDCRAIRIARRIPQASVRHQDHAPSGRC